MVNWVDVLRRVMMLYNVKTQQELGMAIGIPAHIGMEGSAGGRTIPWQILERVVEDRKVSWDWLLTGKEHSGEKQPEWKDGAGDETEKTGGGTPGKGTGEAELPLRPYPSQETRELERELLDSPPGENGTDPGNACGVAAEELKSLKAEMERKIGRIERELDEQR